MPCTSIFDLPDLVRDNLPRHAQKIYMEALNGAWLEYARQKDRRGAEFREEVAHKVAWSAVKKRYSKRDDGDWHAD